MSAKVKNPDVLVRSPSPGEWTDDTSMAVCLADSLIENCDLEETDLMRRCVGGAMARTASQDYTLTSASRHGRRSASSKEAETQEPEAETRTATGAGTRGSCGGSFGSTPGPQARR